MTIDYDNDKEFQEKLCKHLATKLGYEKITITRFVPQMYSDTVEVMYIGSFNSGMVMCTGLYTLLAEEAELIKLTGIEDSVNIEIEEECKHEKKYLNIISNNLKFWCCPKCKKELKE